MQLLKNIVHLPLIILILKKKIKLVFYIYYVLLRTLYLTYAALLGLERIFVYLISGAHVSWNSFPPAKNNYISLETITFAQSGKTNLQVFFFCWIVVIKYQLSSNVYFINGTCAASALPPIVRAWTNSKVLLTLPGCLLF